ncbi:MAG: DUF134 domain-containing protein [Vallitalea sp.]|jgi:predicted DNA-binding protein (UPF0251 family)|nr:DUF134 domain-containing protein [Vallitalea sp.]
MSRPKKCRRVDFFPKYTYFKPIDRSVEDIEEVVLNIEELEAMRLKDIEGFNQEQCAKRMHISRQTFQNIIESARKKVTKALTKGMAINITGGIYSKECEVKCTKCQHEYRFEFSKISECPKCKSATIYCQKKERICNRKINIRKNND